MTIWKRIIFNTFGNIFGIGLQAIHQLISVPILLSLWGPETFGTWLMLTTIPTYFALTDLGFSAAATSDMTMAVARNATAKVQILFQSVWTLVLIIGILGIALASPLIWLPYALPVVSFWWPKESQAMFIMIIYSAAALLSQVVLSGFRSTGHYASGTVVYELLIFMEWVVLILTAWLGGTLSSCCVALLAVRTANIVVQTIRLHLTVPWLRIGLAKADWSELKRLLKPALAAMAIPTSMAINIQGMILVTGSLVSPAAVAVLVPVRTASRIALQAVGIISRAAMPDFARAVAANDYNSRDKILWLNGMCIIMILLPGALLFGMFGHSLISIWTKGQLDAGRTFVALMAVTMALQGLWYFGSNLLLSVNAHGAFSRQPLMASVIAILIAIPAAHFFGLEGIAITTIASEAICVVAMIKCIKGIGIVDAARVI